jgi:hypothetical protein
MAILWDRLLLTYDRLGPSIMASACISTFNRIVWCIIPLEQHTWKSLWFDTNSFHAFFIAFNFIASFFQLLGACLTGSLFTDMLISDGTEPTGITLLKAGLFMQSICFALFTLVGMKFAFTNSNWTASKTQRYPLPKGANLMKLNWMTQIAVIVITVGFQPLDYGCPY